MSSMLTLIIKFVLLILFGTLWGFLGFFYWILILGRVVFFVGARLFSALFTQTETPDLSAPVEGATMLYFNGFVVVFDALFGKKDNQIQNREPLIIKSFYELVATIFIAYLMFALVFPSKFLPTVSDWVNFGEWVGLIRPGSESNNPYAMIWALVAGILASLWLGVVLFRSKVNSIELVEKIAKKNILTEDNLRELADELNVSLLDLKQYLDAKKRAD